MKTKPYGNLNTECWGGLSIRKIGLLLGHDFAIGRYVYSKKARRIRAFFDEGEKSFQFCKEITSFSN
jgi:hypothetical protein